MAYIAFMAWGVKPEVDGQERANRFISWGIRNNLPVPPPRSINQVATFGVSRLHGHRARGRR